MSKVHPWMVCFDLPMPQEVSNLLRKEILGRTRYGVEGEEKPGSVAIMFSSLRRLCNLFDQFEDCGEFKKQLGEGKGEAKLIVNGENGTMMYTAKEEPLRDNFIMDIGIAMASASIDNKKHNTNHTRNLSIISL